MGAVQRRALQKGRAGERPRAKECKQVEPLHYTASPLPPQTHSVPVCPRTEVLLSRRHAHAAKRGESEQEIERGGIWKKQVQQKSNEKPKCLFGKREKGRRRRAHQAAFF